MFTPNYAALISAARSGNANAMEALYNTTFKGVYYTAQKITGNAQDAEELAQETYIKIFSSLDQVQDPAAFPAWANRIASNISISYLRKSRPVLFATDEQEELTLGSIPETTEEFLPAEFVQTQDKREKLMAAIEELPEKQRTAIYMHYFSEMPLKDVAQELGVNENTVKNRLNAGRASIRAKLEKLGITSAGVITLTAALRVDSQAAQIPATARASVWGSLASAAAVSSSTAAGAGAVSAASAAAGTVGAGVSSAVSAGTAAATGTGVAAAAGAAAASAAAVTVKAGLFASLGAKIAAGVLAGVIAISGGAAVVAKTIANKPIDGVPEEMQIVAKSLDPNEEIDEMILDALRYDFGEVEETFDFEGLATVERYADGYSKVYLEAELLEDLPIEPHIDSNVYLSVDGPTWHTHNSLIAPYCWSYSGEDPDSAYVHAVCAFQDDGSAVVYQYPVGHDDPEGEPLFLLIGNSQMNEIYIELTREETSHPQEEDLPVEEIPEEEPEEIPASGPRLAELLDFSKAWSSTEKFEGEPETYILSLAFEPNGKCTVVFGWQYSDIYAAYLGTYHEENGRVTFTFTEGVNSTQVYTFLVTEQNGSVVLVQESDEGFYSNHNRGFELKLTEDDSNSAARVRELAAIVLDPNYNDLGL